MHRLRLGPRGPRQRVIDRRRLALGQRLLHDDIDHRPVLGVHANQRAVLRRLPHRLEDRGVIDHQHVGIRHEQLEAGHALAHQVVHVFEARIGQIGHDHVQTVVDARLALGLLPPCVERRAHLRTARLNSKVHDRRRPANRRCPRPSLKIVCRVGPAERHIEMRVRIDAAGQQQQPRRVHNGCRRIRRNVGAHVFNHAPVDQHIGTNRGIRAHDVSVLNQGLRHKN